MKNDVAIEAFQALGHEIRLNVFRLLMREGPDGLPAGKISELLNVAPSTLSLHLHVLRRAGVIKSARSAQRVIYSADVDGTRELLEFLTQECCNNSPEICEGLFVNRKRF